MKRLLLGLLIAGTTQAQIKFDYEPEMICLVSDLNNSSLTDLIKVQSHAIKWLYKTIDDHRKNIYRLNTQEIAYLRYISDMLTDICFELGEIGL